MRARLSFSICAILLFPFICFGHGSEIHNNQVLSAIYGMDGWREMKHMPATTKVPYYILTDALYVAIDYNGTSNTNRLKEINKNLNAIGKEPIPEMEWEHLGGGNHRAYNHQGLYYNYPDSVDNAAIKNQRLERGRNFLISVISRTLDIDDDRSAIVALELYSIHLLGDLQEGKTDQIPSLSKELDMLVEDLSNKGASLRSHKHTAAVLDAASKISEVGKSYSRRGIAATSSTIDDAIDQLGAVFRLLNKDLDINFDVSKAQKVMKVSKILSRPAVQIGGDAVFSLIGSVVGQGLTQGFSNVNWSKVAINTGLAVMSSSFEELAEIGGSKLLSSAFKKAPNGVKASASFGIFVVADSIFDVGTELYAFARGNQGWRTTATKGAIALVGNGASYAISIGLTAVLTPFLGPAAYFVSGLISFGTYSLIDGLTTGLVSDMKVSDIRAGAKAGPSQIDIWINDYWSAMDAQ